MKKFILAVLIITMAFSFLSCGKSDTPVPLTLEDVTKLALKGEDLTWKDFERFQGHETGSGLFIMVYPIDDVYTVMIGGPGPDSKPMYIYLENRVTGQRIDIRKDNIDDFLSSSGRNAIIAAQADLNHDGEKEKVVIDLTPFEENQFAALKIIDSAGRLIWEEYASTAHAGWTTLYLYRENEADFLIRYDPYMNQGYATYRYEIFKFDQIGNIEVIKSNQLDFSLNSADLFDIDAMLNFADEVNTYLSQSLLLLSTDHGRLVYGTKDEPVKRIEEFSWLDSGYVEFEKNDSLKEKLQKYKEYILDIRQP